MESLLELSGNGVAPYSARGLLQTLTPIDAAAQLRRTINGALLDLSGSQFRKFKSSISGNDQLAPAMDSIWPGLLLTVKCAQELSYKTAGGAPTRPVVSGSSRTEGDFTYYRPQLQMRVASWTCNGDEWNAATQWTLDLEEA